MAVPMPIRLDAADAAASPVAGRVAFVLDPFGHGAGPVVEALGSLPEVVAPARPSGVYDDGLDHLVGNYLSAVHIGGGVSALADEQTFLRAVRSVVDAVHSAALAETGAQIAVDAGTTLASAQLVDALHPDALVIGVAEESDRRRDILSSGVLWLTPQEVSLPTAALRERLGDELERWRDDRPRTRPTPGPPGRETSPLRDRAVFIVGCPRSGTTWLEHMLGAHPATGGPGRETAIFEALVPLWRRASGPAGDPLEEWIGRDALADALRRCCDSLFVASLLGQGRVADETWFVEKTPGHGWCLDLVAAVYPDARVVSIHRDGRDVARSLLEVEFGVDDLGRAAAVWARLTSLIEASGRRCAHFRDIEYEELLEDPVGGVGELMEWIGLPPDDAVSARLAQRAGERVSRYNTAGVVEASKWRSMRQRDLFTIYRHAGDRLVELGYLSQPDLDRLRRSLRYRLGTLTALARRPLGS